MNKRELKQYLRTFLKDRGVVKASLFGSAARENNIPPGDIDIIVQLEPGKNLLDLAGLKIELEESLKHRIDILTFKSIHPLIKEHINKDEEILF